MIFLRQIIGKFSHCKSQISNRYFGVISNRIYIVPYKNVDSCRRDIHATANLFVKLFMERENKYAYYILQQNGYVDDLSVTRSKNSLSKEQFDYILTKNWSEEPSKELFHAFSLLTTYCYENNICISNNIFDNFIDALTDNIQYSSDEELRLLFFSLAQCPETASIRTRNYVEVWAALDDECENRFKQWSYDKMLSFIGLFYMLSATKASDFCYKSIQKLTFKANKLSKPQLVQTLFFIGAMRFSPYDMHNVELAIQDKVKEFSVDELAVISLGFFKSKVPIRSMSLVSYIIDKVAENASKLNEVSLAALLKIIRFSRKIPIDDKINDLLEILQHEVPRLSIMCNVHIALLATSTLTLHEGCLETIANYVVKNISCARLKDLERLTLTFGTFNFIPKTCENFIEKVIYELRRPEREQECSSHGRSFACCVSYLGLLDYHPLDLYKRVMQKEFLDITYGKYCHAYGREILTIYNLAKIFHDSNFEGLSEKEAVILAKKYTDYLPDESFNKQYNVTEKMFLDVQKVIETLRGGSDFVVGHHILTHYQRGDLVVCDDKNDDPVPVKEIFKQMKFGKICAAPDDENIWISLVIAGRNAIINNSKFPSGHILSKIRELNVLGFHAAPVCWDVYVKCKTMQEKKKYISSVIMNAKRKAFYSSKKECNP